MLATYSCVQDTTEDLAPVISGSANGSGEVKALQVALPTPSRTELGDKVDGKYPVYWCAEEGKEDVLAVNGQPTTKITLVNPDANNRSSVAIFDMPLQSSIPYNIVYPYSADVEVDTASGMYPVKFASEQKHTEGSFATGSAPMYAWSDGFSEVQMRHLASVLRFTIKAPAGEQVDLKYISVSTVEAEPIAGVFDVYCGSGDEEDPRTGELKARESATSTVFYTFEEGSYVLSEQAQDFYIVVPNGSYSCFDVNFVAQDGSVCARTFNASGEDASGNSLALVGGKVREFPAVEFEVNSKMLLVGTDADMLTFAEEVKAGSFNGDNSKYSGVLLITDVDMTGKELATIDGFASIFEGRNYTIKGLTQPLFGENTVATISNLNVEGNIVETSNGKVGMIARSLAVDGDKVGTIFNCSAKGTLSYNNSEITLTSALDLINVGGVVGGVYGANVSLSKSYVAVTVDSVGPANSSTSIQPCIGGVTGYICATTNSQPVVVENKNEGSIVWSDMSNGSKIRPFIGGVAGYVEAGEFTDNVNEGVLAIEKPMYNLDWGGVAGASSVTIERCSNHGSMSMAETVATANIGGVVGNMLEITDKTKKTSLVDCDNYGKLLFGDDFTISSSCNIGGVVANVNKGVYSVKGCDNYGQIEYSGNCVCASTTDNNGKNNASIRLGGVVAVCFAELLSECNNMKGANIKVAGSVSGISDPKNPDKLTSIAGIVAVRAGKKTSLKSDNEVRTEKCSNAGSIHCSYKYYGKPLFATAACIGVLDSDSVDDCHNAESGEFLCETSVAFTGNGVSSTTRGEFFVAGLISNLFSDCNDIKNCSNAGAITYDNASATTLSVSGLLGFSSDYSNVKLENCSNGGVITVGKNVQCNKLILGGIAAATSTYRSCSYEKCFNSKNVIAKATAITEAQIGGLFGETNKSNKKGAAPSGLYNSGSVIFEGNAPTVYLGGYSGVYTEEVHGVEFSNTGSVEFGYNENANISNIYIGGFVGKANVNKSSSATATSDAEFVVKNSGNIEVSGYAENIYASGGFGHVTALSGITGLSNEGKVEVKQTSDASADGNYPTNIYAGGVFGLATISASSSTTYTPALRACDNSGSIIYKGFARDGAYVGGVVGKATTSILDNCENTGSIVSSGQAGDWASRLSESEDKKRRYVPMLRHDLAIGGVVGETDYNVQGCTNSGEVTHTCLPNELKYDEWGATASSRFDIGGVIGRVYTESTSQKEIVISGLTNMEKGKITVYGSPEATTQSSSMDLNSSKPQSNDINDKDRTNAVIGYRMNLAGVVGRVFDNIVKAGNSENVVKMTLVNCTNEASISLPEATRAKNLNVAGVVADILATHASVTNAKNSGNITVDKVGFGTSEATTSMHPSYFTNIGGVAALCYDMRYLRKASSAVSATSTLSFNDCENSGKLYYGEVGSSFFQTAGGILAQALQFYGPLGWAGSGTSTYVHYRDMAIDFNNCRNSGDIQYYSEAVSLAYNYSYAGGILGNSNNPCTSYAQAMAAIDVAIKGCSNSGNIQFDRSNGYVSTNSSESYSAVGGIVGFYCGGHGIPSYDIYQRRGRSDKNIANGGAYNLLIESCRNTGRVWTYSGSAGGIIGRGYWYVKITGTADNPTINEGDIVVAREGGNIVLRNTYGSKVIHAGGIAGTLTEYSANTRYLWRYEDNDEGDEGSPDFPLGSQYVRVEHAINKGAVGSTNTAGGIVGFYRSMKFATALLYPDRTHLGGIEFCRNEGNIYSLEGATSNVGAIIGVNRNLVMTAYSSTSSILFKTEDAEAIADKEWPQGVSNCEIGGSVLRGANRVTTPDAKTFQNCIYGENWNDAIHFSNIEGKKYDGCVLYEGGAQNPEGDE